MTTPDREFYDGAGLRRKRLEDEITQLLVDYQRETGLTPKAVRIKFATYQYHVDYRPVDTITGALVEVPL